MVPGALSPGSGQWHSVARCFRHRWSRSTGGSCHTGGWAACEPSRAAPDPDLARSMEPDMIDHIGLSVSDYERSKAFYLAVLAPLGYGLIMELREAGLHAGSGSAANRTFGSARARPRPPARTSRWRRPTGRPCGRSTRPRSRPEAATTDRRACARSIILPTTALSCSTRTATISRRSATTPSDPPPGKHGASRPRCAESAQPLTTVLAG